MKRSINPAWEKYYFVLEAIRVCGSTNMYAAAPILANVAGISSCLAKEILHSWISNYEELQERYHWQQSLEATY